MASLTRVTNKAVDISKLGNVADLSKLGNVSDLSKLDNVTNLRRVGNVSDLSKLDDISDLSKIRNTSRLDYMLDVRRTAERLGDTNYIKRIDDQLDNITRINKVDDIADPSLQRAVKSLDNGVSPKKGLKANEAKDVDNSLKKISDDIDTDKSGKKWKDLSESEKSQRAKRWRNTALTVAGVTIVSALIIKSKIDTDRINNTEYRISSITERDKIITVMYEPRDKFSTRDSVTISESNSVPKIDGEINIKSATNGKITFEGATAITSNGNTGKMMVFTTFENQFSQNTQDAVRPITQTATDVVRDTASTLYDGLVPDNLKKFFEQTWIISLIVSIICSLIISGVSIYQMYKSN
jgi:hypothetical protein